MKHPHIPRTWTAREALAVAEGLQRLFDDVFEVYYAEIRLELLAGELDQDALAEAARRSGPLPAEDLSPF